MDQSALVTAGQALVKALDAAGFPPRLAMWVSNTDAGTWKLWLVPPVTRDEKGKIVPPDKHDFYRRLAVVIAKERDALGGIDASSTEMVLDNHPAVKGISRIFKVHPFGNVYIPGNRYNGYYLPDGIILRSHI